MSSHAGIQWPKEVILRVLAFLDTRHRRFGKPTAQCEPMKRKKSAKNLTRTEDYLRLTTAIKQRHFVHKCRACGAEKLVLASKTATVPTCCSEGGRMVYAGVREVFVNGTSAASSEVSYPRQR
jgi:hypothetical protein